MNKDRSVTIYTLTCPITNDVKYVGSTVSYLEKRLIELFYDAVGININNKKWFDKLKKLGLLPIIEPIDIATNEDRNELEHFWIQQLTAWGFKLNNVQKIPCYNINNHPKHNIK